LLSILLAGACLGVLVTRGSAKDSQVSDLLVARQIDIVDANGRLLGRIGGQVSEAVPPESAGIAFTYPNGKPAVLLGVTKAGPALSRLNLRGQSEAILSTDPDGPELEMYDSKGRPRIGVEIRNHGPLFKVWNEDNTKYVFLAPALPKTK
jgi:hypothetical protein